MVSSIAREKHVEKTKRECLESVTTVTLQAEGTSEEMPGEGWDPGSHNHTNPEKYELLSFAGISFFVELLLVGFNMLYNIVMTFGFVNEILKCDLILK